MCLINEQKKIASKEWPHAQMFVCFMIGAMSIGMVIAFLSVLSHFTQFP